MAHSFGASSPVMLKRWNGTAASTEFVTVTKEPDGSFSFTATRDETRNPVTRKVVVDSDPAFQMLISTISALA